MNVSTHRHSAYPVSVVSLAQACTSAFVLLCKKANFTNHVGLFLGTAGSLQHGGPVGEHNRWSFLSHLLTYILKGLLLGYAAMGTICYSVMVYITFVVVNMIKVIQT